MLSERLQILISPEQKRRLAAEAAEQGVSVGGLIRSAIDSRYGRPTRQERIDAVEAIKSMRADVPDDPAELDRIIDDGRHEEALRGLDLDAFE